MEKVFLHEQALVRPGKNCDPIADALVTLCEGRAVFEVRQGEGGPEHKHDFVHLTLRGYVLPQYAGVKGEIDVQWQGVTIGRQSFCSSGPFVLTLPVRNFRVPSTFVVKLRFPSLQVDSKQNFDVYSRQCLAITSIEYTPSADQLGSRLHIIKAAEDTSREMGLKGDYLTPDLQRVITARITEALTTGIPYSAVRMGDGEGRVLGYPDYFTDQEVLTQLLYYHFGPESMGIMQMEYPDDWIQRSMMQLKEMLLNSLRNADLVGLPVSDFYHEREAAPTSGMLGYAFAMFCGLATTRHLPREAYVGTNIFQLFAAKGLLFKEIARHARGVTLVGPWDLTDPLSVALEVPELRYVRVPGHYTWRGSKGYGQFPHLYRYVEESLIALGDLHGQLFLVGAGLYGKYYCDLIKSRGGVALDIGSVFDSWAGKGLPYAVNNKAIQIDKLKQG